MSPDTPLLLPHLFATVAGRHPGRVAVDVPPGAGRPHRRTVTYAHLRRQAAAVTSAMHPVARPEAVVALLLGRHTLALYAAQLGVLAAGCAFTCLEPRAPDEHLARVLEDAQPVALLTDSTGRARLARLAGLAALGRSLPPVLDPDDLPPAPEDWPIAPIDPADLAYVLYTSGTTGKPKGVLIEHRSIANLVAADRDEFRLTPDDRVAQCSSPAYDSSLEETWLAFAAGATLVPLDDDTVRLGPDLVPWLRRERISVLCPPPTLLRATACPDPARALPDLHLLYVGGEPLPPDLADLWAPGRRLVNGYGPTECTVTVTRGPVRKGEPVTIGTPVRGHTAHLLDDALTPVPEGEPGELCLAGVGLARGYRGRDALTADKFPTLPGLGRVYRTGDRARRLPDGRLEHLGRLDSQVKLRGYRIELEAVEAHLAACPGVRAAACRLQDTPAGTVLAAHVVPNLPDSPPAPADLKEHLRRHLPDYMVPARFALAAELPTTLGGKLDRGALPPIPEPAGAGRPVVPPRDDAEHTVACAFAQALHLPAPPSVHDDFFLDLGGDSLSAVACVCALRAATGRPVTVRDLYESHTVAALAAVLSRRPPDSPSSPAPRPMLARLPDGRLPGARPGLATLAQALLLAVALFASAALSAWLVLVGLPWLLQAAGLAAAALLLPVLVLAARLLAAPLAVTLTAALQRLLIGRSQPGVHPAWGSYYLRHWIVTRAAALIPWRLLAGTVFQSAVLRTLGARVGRRVHVHAGVDLTGGAWDLLTLGDDVTLACDAEVRTADLRDGCLVLGPVTLGDRATLDVRAGLGPDATVERDGYLTYLSWLPTGTVLPAGQRWDGVPAAPAGSAPPRPQLSRAPLAADLPPALYGLLLVLGRVASDLLAVVPFIAAVLVGDALVPNATARVLAWLDDPQLTASVLALVLAAVCAWLPVSLACRALALRALGRVRPGVYGATSVQALSIALKTAALDAASDWLSGSLFWPLWLRLAGMRIGSGCEISTVLDVLPETVSVGPGSFFADGVYLCPPVRHRGTITVADTSLGAGTFLGNHAVIPAGPRWPEDFFVGVATVADPRRAWPGSGWFGHPPLELPRRDVVATDRRLTHEPGPVRFCTRLVWETLRFALPALPLLVACAWYVVLARASAALDQPTLYLAAAPAATLAALAAPCLAVLGLKWMLLGRVRPGRHPLWSCWCSRWDFLFMAWAHWAHAPLAALEGTLLLNAFLRLTGMRLGRRVLLGRGFAQVVDPDMITLEDDATVTGHFQAHSFEDRVLKIDRLTVGRAATAAYGSVLFYGAAVGAGATVEPHAVVMKNEVLPPAGRYTGSPIRRA